MSASDSAVALEDLQRGVEIVATATRRRFTASYKLTVLREAAACTEPAEIGCLLRREGLYPFRLCSGVSRGWRGSSWGSPLPGEASSRRGRAGNECSGMGSLTPSLRPVASFMACGTADGDEVGDGAYCSGAANQKTFNTNRMATETRKTHPKRER